MRKKQMRKSSPHKSIGWILSLCFVGLVTGCVGMNANTLKPMPRGEVVDEETGKPISGAYVLVRYIGDSGVVLSPDPGSLPSDVCYGSLVTKTDKAGRFDFSSQGRKKPVSLKLPRNQRMEITAYKPGYTMETTGGRITRRYEVVGIGSTRLEMTPQEKSKFETRNKYLSDLTYDSTCDGGYGIENWKMERAVLEEVEQSAKSLGEWGYAHSLCKLINMRNEYQNLGHTVLDCSVYAKKYEQIRKKRADRLIAEIKNIDWRGLPKLEILEFKFLGDFENHIAAYNIRPPIHEITETIAMKILRRLCTTGKKIEKGSICLINGSGMSRWKKERWNACDVQYGPYWPSEKGKLLLRLDGVMKQVLSLSPGWCDR